MAETLPNLPALFPPARAKLKALPARPMIGLPSLSFTTIVIKSVLPDGNGRGRKTDRGLRSTDGTGHHLHGWPGVERDAAHRRGECTGRARRGSGEESRVGSRRRCGGDGAERPAADSACESKLKALLARPLIALPEASLTRSVSRSVLPETTVGLAKLTVEFVALIV